MLVSWGDCDPAGIVFYPRYFEWFDRATHQLLAAMGLGHDVLQARWGLLGLSLVDAQATFRQPARQGQVLAVVSTIAKVGRSSLTISHEVACADQVVVSGREVRVWTMQAGADPTQLVAAAIPEAVRQQLVGV